MPYMHCPRCNRTFHMNIGSQDAQAWESRFEKDKTSGLPKSLCYACWQEEDTAIRLRSHK